MTELNSTGPSGPAVVVGDAVNVHRQLPSNPADSDKYAARDLQSELDRDTSPSVVLEDESRDESRTVSETLENAIAHAVSQAQHIIDAGIPTVHGIAAAEPEALAEALDAGLAFVAKLGNIQHDLKCDEVSRRAEERAEIEAGEIETAEDLAADAEPETVGAIKVDNINNTKDRLDLLRIIDGLNERHRWAISTLAEIIVNTDDHGLADILGGIQSHIHVAREHAHELDDWRKAIPKPAAQEAGSSDVFGTNPPDDHIRKAISISQLCFAAATNENAADVHEEIAEAMIDIQGSLGEALKALSGAADSQGRDEPAEPTDDAELRAYCRGMRDGLWHGKEAIKLAERDLRIDRMNQDGSFPKGDDEGGAE